MVAEVASGNGDKPGITRRFSVDGMDYIAILNRVYPSGQKVWSSAEVTRINQAQSAFLVKRVLAAQATLPMPTNLLLTKQAELMKP